MHYPKIMHTFASKIIKHKVIEEYFELSVQNRGLDFFRTMTAIVCIIFCKIVILDTKAPIIWIA
jgi:hypothetical protein